MNKCIVIFLSFLLFFTSTVLGQSVNSGTPIIDGYLLEHSIFGLEWVKASNQSTTPHNGLVGTPGYLDDANHLTVNGSLYADSVKNPGGELTMTEVSTDGSVVYRAKDAKTDFTGNTAAVTQISTNPYPFIPPFPDLSGVVYPATKDSITLPGTYSPGDYSVLNPNYEVTNTKPLRLTAGVYSFTEITIGWGKTIEIVPDADGNYKTVIYIQSKFNINNSSELITSADGLGQILLIYQGASDFSLVSGASITGTIIAPNATVDFNDGATLNGQVLAKRVDLLGFKGGEDLIFTPFKQSKVTVAPDYFLEDTTVDSGSTQSPHESNSYTTAITLTLDEPAGDSDGVVSYKIVTQSGTGFAEHGTDFRMTGLLLSGTLTFPQNGVVEKTISLDIVDDSLFEGTETFDIIFYGATSNINIGGDTLVKTISIFDDDPDNEKPTDLTLSGKSLNEESAVGTTIGSLGTSDDYPVGDSHIYSIYDTASSTFKASNGLFQISGNTIQSAKVFDYETEVHSYIVTLRVTDSYNTYFDSTVTITINPINDSTNVSASDSFTVAENAILNAALPGVKDGDLAASENLFRYSVIDQPDNALNFTYSDDGSFNYTPQSANVEFAIDSFSYRVIDSTTYDLTPRTGNKSWAYITIANVNDEKPGAARDTFSLFENETVTLDVLSNDSTPYETGDNLTITKIIGTASVGVFTIAPDGKSISYTHTGSNEKPFSETVQYVLSDNGSPLPLMDTAEIALTILPINDNKGDAVNDSYTTPKGVTLTVPVATGVLLNDTDADRHPTLTDGNVLTASYKNGSAKYGTVVMNSNGSFTYVNDGQNGVVADTFWYYLSDGISYESESKAPFTHTNADSAMVIISITENYGLNDPSANEGALTVVEKDGSKDTIALIGTLVDDSDLGGGDALKFTYTGALYGSLNIASGTTLTTGSKLIYTYDQTATVEEFSDTIFYTVTDRVGTSASNRIVVTIAKLNDNIPTIEKDTVPASFGKVNTVQIPTASDLDEPVAFTNIIIDSTEKSTATKGILTLPSEGTVTWLSDGTFGYEPNINSTALIDSFQYQILDTVSYDSANVHRVSAWMIIEIDQGSKGSPIAVADNYTLNEGASITQNVMTNDLQATVNGVVNSGPLLDSVRIVKSPSYHKGTFTLSKDGKFTYIHNDTENFSDQFSYILVDQSGAESGEQVVTIVINRLNDNEPSAPEITITLNEGAQKTVSVITGLEDLPEMDEETDWEVTLSGVNGNAVHADSVTLNSSAGTITYYHDGTDKVLKDTVHLSVRDVTPYDVSSIHTVERLVIVTIVPVDDNDPIALDTVVEIHENESITIDLSDKVEDLDGTPITVSTATTPSMGTITAVSGTSITYKHNGANEKPFTDAFTYVAKSELKTSVPATVTITIIPVNDSLAVAAEDSYSVKKGELLTVPVASGVLFNDRDGDRHSTLNNGNVLTVQYKNGTAKHGTVTLNKDGSFTCQNDGQNGVVADTFWYYLSDSISYVAETIAPYSHVKADSARVIIAIQENYDLNKPAAKEGALSVEESMGSADTTLLLTELITDGDLAGGDSITFSYRDPLYGTVTLIGSQKLTATTKLVYAYESAITVEEFSDTITYFATDRAGNRDSSIIVVTIAKLNDNAPVIANDTVTAPFGSALAITIPTVTDGDIPTSENKAGVDSTITLGTKGIVTAPSEGTVLWTSNNSFTYEPNVNSIAAIDSFQYQILDSVSYDAVNVHRETAWIYVILDQSSKGDPIAVTDSITLDEGESYTGNVMANDLRATVAGVANSGPVLDSVRLIKSPLSHVGTFVLNRDGSFTFTHNNSEYFSDQFTYILVDSSGNESVEQTVTITINPLNDNTPEAPELNYSIDEGDSGYFDVTAELADLPVQDIETEWVIALDGVNGQAKFADSVVYHSATGEIAYYHDGSDSALIDTVYLTVKDSTPYDLGAIHTIQRMVIFTINPIDDNLPTARDTSVTIYEGESIAIDLSLLIKDNDGTALTIDTLNSPLHGTITMTGTSLVYQHDGNKEAPFIESIRYVAQSQDQNSLPALVTIRITPINDNFSVANSDSYTVSKGKTLTVNVANGVLANDTDADQYSATIDGNILTSALKSTTAKGTLTLNDDGSFTYVNNGENGVVADTFWYYLSDSITYETETKAPFIHDLSDSAMVVIAIEQNFGLNDPTAIDTLLSIEEKAGNSITIPLIGTFVNDGDIPGGDSLSFVVLDPSLGTVSPSTGTVLTAASELVYTYTEPVETELFADTIRFSVTDRAGTTAEGFVAIDITPLNDNAPAVDTVFVTVQFGKTETITLSSRADKDLPAGDNKPVLDATNNGIVKAVTEGTLTYVDDYTFTYLVDYSSAAVADTFTYRVIDTVSYDPGTIQECEGVVIITIDQSSKGTPVAVDDKLTVYEGGTGTVTVLTNDKKSALSGADIVTVTLVDSGDFGSTVTLEQDGTLNYLHDDSENFSDTITYTITDEAGQTSAVASVIITVEKRNDNEPTVGIDTIYVSEGGTVVDTILTAKESDVDVETILSVQSVLATAPSDANSSVTVTGNGAVTFVHSGLENAVLDSFEVVINDVVAYDPLVNHEVVKKVIVVISPVNDNAPEILPFTVDTVPENGSVIIDLSDKVTDPDGGDFSVTLVNDSPLTGIVTLTGKEITYTHLGEGTEIFADSIEITISDTPDGQGNVNEVTVTIPVTIAPLNDEPAVGVDETFTLDENDTLKTSVAVELVVDTDRHPQFPDAPYGSRFTFVMITPPSEGTMAFNEDGTFTYVNIGSPNKEVFSDSFTYVIVDSALYDTTIHTSELVTVTLAINDVNDEVPVVQDDTISVAGGESATVLTTGATSILDNDSDMDAATVLTVQLVDSVSAGELVLSEDGTFIYTHDNSETYVDSFTYVATDGVHTSEPAVVHIVISQNAPTLETAFYYDRDGDGIVDEIVTQFNHSVDTAVTTFTFTWNGDSVAIPVDSMVKDSNVITFAVTGSEQIATSGDMSVTVSHASDLYPAGDSTGIVVDSAAPVVTAAFFNGTVLAVTLSEGISSMGDTPFNLFLEQGTETVTPVLGEPDSSLGLTYYFTCSETIVFGDSINIALAGSVTDTLGTVQAVETNILQPIYLENSFVSATYFDLDSAKDGRIDLIRMETMFPMSDDQVAALVDGIALTDQRDLRITELVSSASGFDILVEDSSEVIATAVNDSEVVTITFDDALMVRTAMTVTVPVIDSLSPVIIQGVYSQGDDTTLTVRFSEPVTMHDELTTPYQFFDLSTGLDYNMTLSTPTMVDSVSIGYQVVSQSITYPVSGDSLAVAFTPVADSLGNRTELSVLAPLIVSDNYNLGLELYILPQPLVLVPLGETMTAPSEIDEDLRNTYRFADAGITATEGVAFILEASGPLAAPEFHTGEVQILDNVGNAVSDKFDMMFVQKDDGTTAGVAVWDAKNNRDRLVGAGSFLVAVEVSVVTDEGSSSRTLTESFVRVLGVKQ